MRHVVLLRGINLGSRNRIAMPDLRTALAEAGHREVSTYVQSGNVVLESDLSPGELADDCRALIAERFGLDIAVVTRSQPELAAVVEGNPIPEATVEPKRYQVTFLSEPLSLEITHKLQSLAAGSERITVTDREVYAWHPEGVARSKLWNALAGSGLGTTATSRNWTTVETLLEMASRV